MALQSSFFTAATQQLPPKKITARAGTFVDNMSLPVHRWFRYSAGFSADWVEAEIRRTERRLNIFDPFAGSGTTLLAAENTGQAALGQEAHPFVFRVGEAKLDWYSDVAKFLDLGNRILAGAKQIISAPEPHPLLSRCYSPEVLSEIQAIRNSLASAFSNSSRWRLCWLAFVSILRSTSQVGTAQWQYLLPNKQKSKVVTPLRAYESQLFMIASDMSTRTSSGVKPSAGLLNEDCRIQGRVPNDWADLVITSPPYINNYDYADATRLEMTVLGEIKGWGDLQTVVRQNLVRSCTQHVAPYAANALDLLESTELAPIRGELGKIFDALAVEKKAHGGKKAYDAMIVHYFHDMALVWRQLRRIAREGSRVCFVLGDSAPYGVYVPVEEFHARLALSAGFQSYEFTKIRDRNLKWKNRKHQVPLKEGYLWLNG